MRQSEYEQESDVERQRARESPDFLLTFRAIRSSAPEMRCHSRYLAYVPVALSISETNANALLPLYSKYYGQTKSELKSGKGQTSSSQKSDAAFAISVARQERVDRSSLYLSRPDACQIS